ncbi:hypothetical protein [Variovorax ginsengisoli]|uniref:Uncharacterized protein n=1 Tax=Variovorax ginsengisoli TaxID=363844 RepID=A0ABT9S3V9_9BURK|nr:hypothetical protein [Variovorax ginsengisoli]MDP9899031.1 hypothetical protein [Variovorax ginsengisoli]
MKDLELKLTPTERAAMIHSLAEWAPDRRGQRTGRSLEHFLSSAPDRVRQLHAALIENKRAALLLQDSELDRALVCHVVESTSWISIHEGQSHQKQSSAFGALQSVAGKVEQALGLKTPLKVPLK